MTRFRPHPSGLLVPDHEVRGFRPSAFGGRGGVFRSRGPGNVVVVGGDAPTVTSISPTSGPEGTGVTITGTNLITSGLVVKLDGAAGVALTNVVLVNSTTITGQTGAHANGLVSVYVATDNGNDTLAAAYTYSVASDWAYDPAASGFNNIVNRAFNSRATSGSDPRCPAGALPDCTGNSEGWDNIEGTKSNQAIATQSAAPVSPSNVMRVTYPVGQTQNTSPTVFQTQPFTGSAHGSRTDLSLYTRSGIVLGPDYWVGNVNNKLFFHRSKQLTTKFEPFLGLANNGSGGFKLGVNFQGTPDNVLGFFYATAGTVGALMLPEVGYRIETYLAQNSAFGVADGVFRCWVDGELCIERTNVEYRQDSTTRYWDTLHVSPTFGGSSAPNPTEFYWDMDDMSVWGKS